MTLYTSVSGSGVVEEGREGTLGAVSPPRRSGRDFNITAVVVVVIICYSSFYLEEEHNSRKSEGVEGTEDITVVYIQTLNDVAHAKNHH